MDLLKVWFGGSALLVGGWLVYEYAPILYVLAVVALVLGGLTALIVWAARRVGQPPVE